MYEVGGTNIRRGVEVPSLEKKWKFEPTKQPGDAVVAGDEIGFCAGNGCGAV